MTLENFLRILNVQKPLLAVEGDIFDTAADHIAFAVHYPSDAGYSNNNNGGFSSSVASHGWPELETIKFKKGEVQSRKIHGKWFHAMAVHTPQDGGWDEAPQLIEQCLNRLPVGSEEVIACVLIGGGNAGEKYKASVRNLEGMVRSYKTVVLYIFNNTRLFELLVGTGVVAQPMPQEGGLMALPKVKKYREQKLEELYQIGEPVVLS